MKFSSVVDSISAVAGGAGINLKMDRDRGELKKMISTCLLIMQENEC